MGDQGSVAAGPLVSNVLVVALIVTTGFQAWDFFKAQAPEEAVPAAVEPPAPIIVNVTIPKDDPVEVPETPVLPPAEPEPPAPLPFTEILVSQAPKHVLDFDFTWDVQVSSTPVAVTPWAGVGVPWVLAYFDHGLNREFNDSKILLNAYLARGSFTGWDLCASAVVRFWDFAVVPPTGAAPMIFQSEPLPENPYNLLGTGENCYTRVLAESAWSFGACMEGDGEITPSSEVVDETARTITRYVDYMDYCRYGIANPT